ncbi:MAG: DUF2235 domain-containing protein [Acidobacteria bacterium]|nr:DUF2235 domain-containing protein [Acidobacteriota bacterium]
MPKRLVICLDGTWNSPARESERDDGDKVFKPSNVLKLARAVKPIDDCTGALRFEGQPAAGDRVTIDTRSYVFRTAGDLAADEVMIGETPKESLKNLRFAINARRQRKPRYGAATRRHETVGARPVAGDRSLLEIFSRAPGGGAYPFVVETTFDAGTWCSRHEIARRASALGLDPTLGIPQIVYYDIGVGALRKFKGTWNKFHRFVDKNLGGARGAGFEGNVEDAYGFLCLNYCQGDEIYLFGFSRGAASARSLSHFIDWMGGVLPARDAYWTPRYFDAFLAGESFDGARSKIHDELLDQAKRGGAAPDKAAKKAAERLGTVLPATIRFLGVWDTVLALGGDRDPRHLKPRPAGCVERACQALAVDEARSDFEPRIWDGPAHDRQRLEQCWFAGVHTSIGGGYVHDGLANTPLRWILEAARSLGLGLDDDFLEAYPAYALDQLYPSYKVRYRIWDWVRGRNGVRKIRVSADAGLTLHPSVMERLTAEPDGETHPRFELYRPKNLLRFLARQGDLEAFLATIPGLAADLELSDEVRRAIARAR